MPPVNQPGLLTIEGVQMYKMLISLQALVSNMLEDARFWSFTDHYFSFNYLVFSMKGDKVKPFFLNM